MLSEENYVRDFFHIANTEILIIGLLLLLVAVLTRTWHERSSSWLRWYIRKNFIFHCSGRNRGSGTVNLPDKQGKGIIGTFSGIPSLPLSPIFLEFFRMPGSPRSGYLT